MILRLFALLIACVCLAGKADAVPMFRLQPSSPLETVQDRDGKRDVWRSPRNSVKNFPYLGQDDCARYGQKNGYPECEGAPLEKPASDAAATPEPSAIQKSQLVAPQVPLRAPLPVRRAKVWDDKAASPWRSGITTSEEPLAAGASAEDRFAKTLGALLIVTFEGRSAGEDGPKRVANALKQGRIGGVLLRRANIESPAQLKALTAFLAEGQAQAPLILIEHSGGSDNALAQAAGFQPIASPREVGARGDALEAFDIYQQMAESSCGRGRELECRAERIGLPGRCERRDDGLLRQRSSPQRRLRHRLQPRASEPGRSDRDALSGPCGRRRRRSQRDGETKGAGRTGRWRADRKLPAGHEDGEYAAAGWLFRRNSPRQLR